MTNEENPRITNKTVSVPIHPTRLCHKCVYGVYLNSDKTWNCSAGCPDDDATVCEKSFKSIEPPRKSPFGGWYDPVKKQTVYSNGSGYPDEYELDKM